MSHFAGLVIMTPDYSSTHELEDSLEKYDENLVMEEYSNGEVSDYDKIRFLGYYKKECNNHKQLFKKLYQNLVKEGKVASGMQDSEGYEDYLYRIANTYQQEYADLFKETYPEVWASFESIYKEYGKSWNGNRWRKNYLTGNFEEYSTYNPDSKYDYYCIGGRWDNGLKTKDGRFVNECRLGDIDWTDFKPEDYKEEEKETWSGEKYHELKDGIEWHFTKSDLMGYLVVDGEWFEQFEGLWFGMTANEISNEEWAKMFFEIVDKIPSDSVCYLCDFHI